MEFNENTRIADLIAAYPWLPSFDVAEGDTLFIHDGSDLNAPVIITANNVLLNLEGVAVFPGQYNYSETLTLEFRTNGDGINGAGFSITVMCRDRCETITPVISHIG